MAFGSEVAIRADLETFISFFDYETRARVFDADDVQERWTGNDTKTFERLTDHFQSCVNEAAVRFGLGGG